MKILILIAATATTLIALLLHKRHHSYRRWERRFLEWESADAW